MRNMRDDWGPWNQGQQDENQNTNQGMPAGQNEGFPPGYPPTGGGFPPGYRPPGSGMATASMVLGILSLVFWSLLLGYIIMAPLAIIFGVIAKKQGSPSGMATAGIVMGIISIVSGILFWVACGAIICAFWDEIWYEVMYELAL